jgi:hypothetical protein
MAIVLRATNDNGVIADLDVRQDVDLRLDISAIENTDIGEIYGVSTQTFALPDTPINNQFFGNLFNLGATPGVALQNSIPCQLLQDGVEIMNGKLYIVDITTNQKGLTFYNVNLVNETMDFKFQLENLDNPLLSSLDWDEYTHKYTYNSITASWVDGVLEDASPSYPTGSIIYPHVNYGLTEGGTDPEYALGGVPGKIDNNTTPLTPLDFKPAIKAKAIVDKIFETLDYKYTSSFFDSAEFENLYVLSTSNESKGASAPTASANMGAYTSVDVDINAGSQDPVLYQTEIFDQSNNYNPATSIYTAGLNGLYRFNTQVTFTIQNVVDPTYERNASINYEVNGIGVKSYIIPHMPTSGTIVLPANLNLVNGDEVTVSIEFFSTDGGEDFRVEAGQFNSYFSAEAPASVIGQEIFYGSQLPPELTCLEFLQALIEKFNLVIEPLQAERNVLLIEPYQNWLDAGLQLDWTDKVDRSVNFKIVHPISEQPQVIKFSDVEDIDVLTKYHKENFGTIYGQYEYRTSSNLANGEKQIGKVFGPCPVKQIAGSSQFVVPFMCKKDAEQPERPFKFKPRLIQRIGLTTVGIEAQGVVNGAAPVAGVGIFPGNYWFLDDVTARLHNQYFAVGALSAVNNVFATDTTLHFNSTNHYPYQEPNKSGYVKADAFRTYWATYLNSELYDIDARKVTMNIYLKPTEYFNFQLNNKIFIDGAYYRINKINGGNLTKSESVEVELIKILNRRLKFPRVRLRDGDIITIDYEVGLEQGGTTTVISDNTGLPVTGSQIGGFLLDNGYQFRPDNGSGTIGSGNWLYTQGATNVDTQKIVGTGTVDTRATNTITTGTENTIQPSSNTLVVGKANTVGQLSENVTILGNEHTSGIGTLNAQFLGGEGNYTSGSNSNLVIVGGTGSYAFNTDYSAIINGYSAGLRDSDVTTLITPHENEVVINGSGHTVIGLNLEGAGLDLLNYRNNSNWLGDTYFGEALFRTPKTINIGDGTSIQLYDTQYKHDSLFVLNWNGLSPGTASIELPSYVNNDYENIQYTFKANGTFDGTTYLELEGFGGTQNIEGNTTYSFTNAYDKVTLVGVSGSWLII